MQRDMSTQLCSGSLQALTVDTISNGFFVTHLLAVSLKESRYPLPPSKTRLWHVRGGQPFVEYTIELAWTNGKHVLESL